MKRRIDIWSNAGEILSAVQNGVLLTSQAEGKTNSMVISWGSLGIEWGKPVFTAYVRANRFTHGLLTVNPEFTVNMPMGIPDRRIMGICGSKSGRDMDKIAEAGLTLVEAERISVPAEFTVNMPMGIPDRRIMGICGSKSGRDMDKIAEAGLTLVEAERISVPAIRTVNMPMGIPDRRIMGICGSKSGRDMDKIAEAGLTLVEAERISVPAIREFPLTLECRIICAEKQNFALLPPAMQNRYYPQHVDGSFVGSNRDAHTAFYGEIVDAYIIEH